MVYSIPCPHCGDTFLQWVAAQKPTDRDVFDPKKLRHTNGAPVIDGDPIVCDSCGWQADSDEELRKAAGDRRYGRWMETIEGYNMAKMIGVVTAMRFARFILAGRVFSNPERWVEVT